MPEHDRSEIGGKLTPEERARSQRILEANFPHGAGAITSTYTDAAQRRTQLLKFFKGETVDLDIQVESNSEVSVAVAPRALTEPAMVYQAPTTKRGLVFRAIIKAVRLYQNFNKRLAR